MLHFPTGVLLATLRGRMFPSICNVNSQLRLRDHLVRHAVRTSYSIPGRAIGRFQEVNNLPLGGPDQARKPLLRECDELAQGEAMSLLEAPLAC